MKIYLVVYMWSLNLLIVLLFLPFAADLTAKPNNYQNRTINYYNYRDPVKLGGFRSNQPQSQQQQYYYGGHRGRYHRPYNPYYAPAINYGYGDYYQPVYVVDPYDNNDFYYQPYVSPNYVLSNPKTTTTTTQTVYPVEQISEDTKPAVYELTKPVTKPTSKVKATTNTTQNKYQHLWITAKEGEVPANALINTIENGKPIYFCRVNFHDRTYFGSLIQGEGCYVESDEVSMRFNSYEVRVSP